MGTIIAAILGFFGGAAGFWGFLGFLGVVLVAIIVASWLGKKGTLLPTIEKLASTAIAAVEQMSNNGQYAGMTADQRHAAKKAAALNIIENGLKAEGITPNTALMTFAGWVIEALLNKFDTGTTTVTPTPTPTPTPSTTTTSTTTTTTGK